MVNKNNIVGLGLSSSQHNIISLEKTFQDTSINNICTSISINGRLDIRLVNKCLNELLKIDECLRIRLIEKEDKIIQYFTQFIEEDFPFFDFSHSDLKGFDKWVNDVARKPFNLFSSKLYYMASYKIDEKHAGVLIKVHHVACDGYSVARLAEFFSNYYISLIQKELYTKPLLISYSKHLDNEKKYIESNKYLKDKEFWEKEVDNNSQLKTSFKDFYGVNSSNVGNRKTFYLSQTINKAISRFCIDNRVSPFSVLCMALAIHLNQMKGNKNFCFGVPVINRLDMDEKKSGGMFVSTLPFFFGYDPSDSLNEFNEKLTEKWYDLLRHQRYPFSEIHKYSTSVNNASLFDIVLSFQDSKVFTSEESSILFTGEWIYSGFQSEQLIVHLTSLESEDKYRLDYDFLTQIYSEEDIVNIHNNIVSILQKVLYNSKTPICKLDLLTSEEYEKVIYTFNQNVSKPSNDTIVHLFQKIVCSYPTKIACIFEDKNTTYYQLNNDAKSIAKEISKRVTSTNNIIAVHFERSDKLYTTLMGVLMTNNAFVIIPTTIPKNRVETLINNSNAKLVIASKDKIDLLFDYQKDILIYEDAISLQNDFEIIDASPYDLAYLVYTSGSSGTPKGALIENAQIVNYAKSSKQFYSYGTILSFCNISFDVFMIESIVALMLGKTVVIVPERSNNDPAEIGKLILKYSIVFFATTPSRLKSYIENDIFRSSLINLQKIYCGGEVFPNDLIRSVEQYTLATLYNVYGPSETTVAISLKEVNNSNLITCGKPLQNCYIYILNEYLKPLPVGAIGEIYIGGVCVGRGYLNNDEENIKSFLINPFENGSRLYKTGDFGYFTNDGELVVIGRKDSQVKLRGIRIELEEISKVLSLNENIINAAVKIVNHHLIGYYQSNSIIEESMLRLFLASYLPSFMIPDIFVKVDEILLTANGKADLSKLPIPVFDDNIVIASNDVQKSILDIFIEVLGNKNIGITHDFFKNGGDSLNAILVLSKINEKFNTNISIAEFYALSTVERISKLIINKSKGNYEKIKCIFKDYYIPTPSQTAIYLVQLSNKMNVSYNMPGVFKLNFTPEIMKISNAFQSLVNYDDNLRTYFTFENGKPLARIKEKVIFNLEIIDACSLEEAQNKFLRPFILSEAPLMRAAIYSNNKDNYLFIDIHHIINDGQGSKLLFNKLNSFMVNSTILPLEYTFKDYVYYYQNKYEQNKDDEIIFWRNYLKDYKNDLILNKSSDNNQNLCQDDNIFSENFNHLLSQSIDDFCNTNKVSTANFFVAIFAMLIKKFSSSNDFIIGIPNSKRIEEETINMTGLFIDTMPVRFLMKEDQNIIDYMHSVTTNVYNLINHFIPPLEVINEIKQNFVDITAKLYNIAFNYFPVDESSFYLCGMPVQFYNFHTNSSKFDLTLNVKKSHGLYKYSFEYNQDIYSLDVISLYSRTIMSIIESILSGVNKLSSINYLSQYDKMNSILLPNSLYCPFEDLPIDAFFEICANQIDKNNAIVCNNEKLNYYDFNKQINCYASYLQNNGVKSNETIGILINRGIETFIAIYAILRLGCSYLPLSVSLPNERISTMCSIANVSKIIFDEYTIDRYDLNNISKLKFTDSIPSFIRNEHDSNRTAQVLFTSGSTGEPKGVNIKHHALCNLRHRLSEIFSSKDCKTILCCNNFLFDSFTMEGIIPLSLGMTVYLSTEEQMNSSKELSLIIRNNNVEALFMTPSKINVFLKDDNFVNAIKGVKLILLGGESSNSSLIETLKRNTNADIYNLYGPCEAAVFVTSEKIQDPKNITIGRPIANDQVYILDENRNLCLPLIEGELYIGGESLCQGYVGNISLTNERFIDNPFGKGKLYRSGDKGILLLDGRIKFIGRKDNQVKLSGQRIELEEIEGAIMQSQMAFDCAVSHYNKDLNPIIVAFIVQNSSYQENKLREYLKEKLPKYMIPSKIILVDCIPKTITGKVDKRKLHELLDNFQVDTSNDINKSPDITNKLESIWKEVLGSKPINDLSFFEQGGSSLGAMSIIISYSQMGYDFTLENFYNNPTLSKQIEIIQNNNLKEDKIFFKGDVLLTGATGFLGSHILNELLKTGKNKVYCLIRNDSKKLYSNLEYYFGKEWLELSKERIIPIIGDITCDKLNINEKDYEIIKENVNIVYHCAADVRHYLKEEDSLKINFEGTKNVCQLVKDINGKLIYISTLSVCGDTTTEDKEIIFDEKSLDIGQNYQINPYIKSKYLSEQYILSQDSKGLDYKIFRVGRLVGRNSDGKFQINCDSNYFYCLIRGLFLLKMIPKTFSNKKVEVTPVDECAKAIVILKDSDIKIAHIANPYYFEISKIFSDISNMMEVDYETIQRELVINNDLSIANKGILYDAFNKLSKNKEKEITIKYDLTCSMLKSHGFSWNKNYNNIIFKEFFK